MADGIYNPNHQEQGENHVICCEHDLDDKVTEPVSLFDKIKIKDLFDTAGLMGSADYKVRFVAEYYQTKFRYEKLKAFNTKIEAARRLREPDYMGATDMSKLEQVKEPKHDCPADMLRAQQHTMGEYLHILELRAVIEGIDLEQYK